MPARSRYASSRNAASSLALLLVVACAWAYVLHAQAPLAPADNTMTVAQLMAMPKVDAHAHTGPMTPAQREAFTGFLGKHNFKWLNIATGGMDWNRLEGQIERARELHRAHPKLFAWATSFNLSNWSEPGWAKSAAATVSEGLANGAVAVKVWKDAGMVLKDGDGSYVMIDDPRFDPVLDLIEKQGATLVAHIGEPRNCWLPLESMTVDSDRNYFAKNPQYHGYLQKEVPGYEKQVAARDRMLERHPRLKVVGAHLGSLEYDVDELAKRLDKYPNLAVDLAARIVHLQIQPREKVLNFVLRYQDRLLYGTDESFGGGADDPARIARELADLEATYRQDATWFATDEEVEVPRARAGFRSRGLALPAPVLRKLYHGNAARWFKGM